MSGAFSRAGLSGGRETADRRGPGSARPLMVLVYLVPVGGWRKTVGRFGAAVGGFGAAPHGAAPPPNLPHKWGRSRLTPPAHRSRRVAVRCRGGKRTSVP